MTERKSKGIQVDSKHIKKHRKDVFVLLTIVDPELASTAATGTIARDLSNFAAAMRNEVLDPKSFGWPGRSSEQMIAELLGAYGLM